jgi:hypothetical protein
MLVDHDDYEPGGEFKELWRELHLSTRGWLHGDEIAQAIYRVKVKANTADLHPSDGAFMALEHAVRKLTRACETQAAHIARLRKAAGDVEAVVTQTRLLHVPETVPNGIPDEDELLERLSDLYGLPRPRHYGRPG